MYKFSFQYLFSILWARFVGVPVNIWDQIRLCCGGWPVHWKMFSSILGFSLTSGPYSSKLWESKMYPGTTQVVQGWEATLQCKFQSLAGEQRPPHATEQLSPCASTEDLTWHKNVPVCCNWYSAQTNNFFLIFKKYIQTSPDVSWGATSPKIQNHWCRMKDSDRKSHLVVSDSLQLQSMEFSKPEYWSG